MLLRPDILKVFKEIYIIGFQETHYSKQDVKSLNDICSGFIGVGAAKIDENSGIVQGRYSGGVAIMWKSSISNSVKPLLLDVEWCVAVEVCTDSTKFVIINIYMPYQCHEHEDLYIERLGFIRAFIDELNSTNFIIIGDFNANLRHTGTNLFASHMTDFCKENELLISSKILLPQDSYSYVGHREGVPHYSWLDHVVCSADFHKSILNIYIGYDISDEDHIPVTTQFDINLLPCLTDTNNETYFKINWESASEVDIKTFLNLTEQKFSSIDIPIDALLCSDLECKHVYHKQLIETFYNNIINILSESSQHMCSGVNTSRNRPGWSDYVSDLYDYSRETRKVWLENGKPRQGHIFQEFLRSKAKFKYAIRFISRHENILRKESLANKLSNLKPKEFWKEIKSINNSKTALPCSIDNASNSEEIIKLWEDHFYNIFNCLEKVKFNGKYNLDTSYNNLKVNNSEIYEVIQSLDLNKSCGMDGIQVEHLKYSSNKLIPLLSMCFSSCFVHGFLPSALMSIVLVPIIKNKAGNVNSRDNYRPIALASILSKLI